jgi:predicted GIY-YIG superfamily endonuclease
MAYELKTKLNKQDPISFLSSVENQQRREDAIKIIELIKKWTKLKPEMWGKDIIGFGRLTYKYSNGKENEWMKIGLSPRKQNITLYIMSGFSGFDSLLAELGPHSTGKSCLYIKDLGKVNLEILEKIARKSLVSLEKEGMLSNY